MINFTNGQVRRAVTAGLLALSLAATPLAADAEEGVSASGDTLSAQSIDKIEVVDTTVNLPTYVPKVNANISNINATDSSTSLNVPTDTMQRVYNAWSGEHLFTVDGSEYGTLVSRGWTGEGTAWYAPREGEDVYRLYNPYSGDHLYTKDASEYDQLGAIGWRKEGVAFHSGGDRDIYRLYNPWLTAGTHLYTTDAAEYARLQAIGWRGEGVAFKAVR